MILISPLDYQFYIFEQRVLNCQDDDSKDDESSTQRGHNIWQGPSDDGLNREGQHQLHTSETSHKVGGNQLQRQGQSCEGYQPR